MIHDYLLTRANLVCAFLLIDIRHNPLKNDMEFLEWLGVRQIPFSIVFTKADKPGKNSLKKNLEIYLKYLSDKWEPIPPYVVSSSETGQGRDELLSFINECNLQYNEQNPHITR
jgi:GTP-binding protein